MGRPEPASGPLSGSTVWLRVMWGLYSRNGIENGNYHGI